MINTIQYGIVFDGDLSAVKKEATKYISEAIIVVFY